MTAIFSQIDIDNNLKKNCEMNDTFWEFALTYLLFVLSKFEIILFTSVSVERNFC